MNLTLSVDEEVVQKARQRAEQSGTSLNQLVREYLEMLAGGGGWDQDADEFERLSRLSPGNSHGWKFNREDLYQRR